LHALLSSGLAHRRSATPCPTQAARLPPSIRVTRVHAARQPRAVVAPAAQRVRRWRNECLTAGRFGHFECGGSL
jgi:hypothetical protein